MVPAPVGEDAVATVGTDRAYSDSPGLFELKTPKTHADLRTIATSVRASTSSAREWTDHPEPCTVRSDMSDAIPTATIDQLADMWHADLRALASGSARRNGS